MLKPTCFQFSMIPPTSHLRWRRAEFVSVAKSQLKLGLDVAAWCSLSSLRSVFPDSRWEIMTHKRGNFYENIGSSNAVVITIKSTWFLHVCNVLVVSIMKLSDVLLLKASLIFRYRFSGVRIITQKIIYVCNLFILKVMHVYYVSVQGK